MGGIDIYQSGVIDVKNVQQSFKVGDETIPALKTVNFSIKANSFTIIFGPSGSGKSTLLNVLAGLQAPSTGNVVVEGKDIYALKPDELAHFRANRVGFMHQTNHWIKSLNVIENRIVTGKQKSRLRSRKSLKSMSVFRMQPLWRRNTAVKTFTCSVLS